MWGARGTHAGGSHVRYCPINGLGTRLYPCGIANGYAVDLHRGLQTQAKQTQPGVPLPLAAGRARTANQPESTGFRAGIRSRGVTKPVSHVYLPVSLTAPAPSGSTGTTRLCRGCSRPPRRPAAKAASSFTSPLRRRSDGRSFTSIRTNSASWRTFLAYTFPSRSPRPAHPAVPGRHDFVEAAPALPGDPRIRLPPAPARCCDSEPMDGLSPPYGQTAPRGAHTKPTQLRAPGKINTRTTRTKRHCPAPGGTPANMTVLAHGSPHAGQTG